MLAADSHGAGIFSVSGPRFPAASSQVTAPSTAHRPVQRRTDTGAVEIQIHGLQGAVELEIQKQGAHWRYRYWALTDRYRLINCNGRDHVPLM